MAGNMTFDKFLTPEAMVTPGIAGSMSMMIGNTLQHQFDLPNGWSVLVLSFVFGLLVWANRGPILKRSILYVINSLVIFCTAVGAIALGATGNEGSSPKKPTAWLSIVQPAYAQTAADLQVEYLKLSAQKNDLWAKFKAAPDKTTANDLQNQIEAVDKRQIDVLNAIAKDAKGKSPIVNTGEKKFFAPLKF